MSAASFKLRDPHRYTHLKMATVTASMEILLASTIALLNLLAPTVTTQIAGRNALIVNFKYLTYVRPLHVIAVTEHWPNGAPHEKRPVEQVMNPLGARDSPHPEIAELPTEETSRDTRPSTTEHRNPALGVPRFMRETAATMNRSRMDESHENSAPEPAFLMGRNCEKYLAKLEKHHQRGDYTKVEELWKKFGCLGRLHNLEFATIIIGGDLSQFDGLELIQNNSTRWNSWFYSITRALNVRERLELFSARHVPGKGSVGIANFKLDGQHWFELEKIELALKDFYAATLLSEGKKTSLADWFSTLDCLLREISETKDHYHDIHTEDDNNFTWKYLQGCADAAWLKCVEYYNNQQLNWQNRFPEDTDLPPTYYAAQILDPYRKWGWFRQEWVLHGDEEKKRWFENAQLAVKHLWETEYKGRYPPGRRDPDPAFDRQREHKRIRIDAPVSTTDLYEQYISTDRLHNEEAGCNEAIAYWLSRYDSQRDLARFALDISAKLTIVDRRGRLKADIIEADIEDSENEDD
ncbi:hypothetical protein A1F94_003873 [Pyrenophora tritici-repentis]|nr:hypothetical protein A1F94_003873 [Pyrenophora tritici-repentis]